jgi:hypothetical protein
MGVELGEPSETGDFIRPSHSLGCSNYDPMTTLLLRFFSKFIHLNLQMFLFFFIICFALSPFPSFPNLFLLSFQLSGHIFHLKKERKFTVRQYY